jgi:hypothetical protein
MGEEEVRIRCNNCQLCPEARRKATHMSRATCKGRNKDDNDRLDLVITHGKRKGEEQTCPAWQILPIESPKPEVAKPEDPEPPKPMVNPFRDFGYGAACRECRASLGEDHASTCPYEGITTEYLGDGKFRVLRKTQKQVTEVILNSAEL